MHRKYALILVLCSLVLASCSTPSYAIDWLYSLDEGLTLAKEQNKIVMADFFTPRCGYCAKLDKETFTDEKVGNLSESFINVKVDVDERSEYMGKYGLAGVPTIIFFDANGQELSRIIGFRDAVTFSQEMEKVLQDK